MTKGCFYPGSISHEVGYDCPANACEICVWYEEIIIEKSIFIGSTCPLGGECDPGSCDNCVGCPNNN